MKINIRFFFLCSFLFFLCSFASALDFGVVLNQDAGYGGAGSDGGFDYSIAVVPWLSGQIGNIGDFIVTGSLELDYNDDDGVIFAPELLRTELSFRYGVWAFEVGRMYHSDPLDVIANGLFDGVNAQYNSDFGTFSLGAWYTGLLYKKRVNIEMTAKESMSLNTPIDYDDFTETYFAPKRFLFALGWEHLGGIVRYRASILGQFDISDEKPLNSQYAAVKFTMPIKEFSFDLGGCLELIQDDGDLGTAFIAEAGIAYTPTIKLKNKVSFLARYSSGSDEKGQFAFSPLTTISQGEILEARLSGITTLSLDYQIRFLPAFFAEVTSTYFIRNDTKTYNGYPLSGHASEGYCLGNEFFARLIWSPATDLRVNLGAGVFLPSLGDVAPNADAMWRVELKAVFSIL